MNIYSIIRLYQRIKSPRLKLLAILSMHVMRRRYLYAVIDPALACNLRCRMCFFSNPESLKKMGGRFSEDDIDSIAKAVFHRVLKLQIGCGAEPTTYKNLNRLVSIAAEHGIRNISLTTNGNLLSFDSLKQLVDSGLSEIILSAHGMSKVTYEEMMRGASFERFTQLIANLSVMKEKHPELRVRINYTMCADNVDDLVYIPSVFSALKPDVIQLRPVQDVGSTAYSNYSVSSLVQKYETCVKPVISFCNEHHITCLYPEPENLVVIDEENVSGQHLNSVVDMLPYFHLSPHEGWKDEFDPYHETFESLSRRNHRVRNMLGLLFGLNFFDSNKQQDTTHALNYSIK